jgi:hypothetical protein
MAWDFWHKFLTRITLRAETDPLHSSAFPPNRLGLGNIVATTAPGVHHE